MTSRSAALIAAVVSVGLVGAARGANWFGGNGNWSDASKWSPANVPDTASETAVLISTQTTSSTITLTSAYTIGGLTLSSAGGASDGPSVSGNFDLNAATLDWTSGILGGTATTTITGAANFNFTGNYYGNLSGRTLNLQGNSTLSSASSNNGLAMTAAATINNSGIFSFTGGAISFGGASSRFNNTGTLRATAGSVSSLSGVSSTNTISAQSGTFNVGLVDNGTSSGTFNAAAGTNLVLSSNTHTLSNPSFTGTGKFTLNGTFKTVGTATASAGTLVLDDALLSGNYTVSNL
jgi:hypothetical protein